MDKRSLGNKKSCLKKFMIGHERSNMCWYEGSLQKKLCMSNQATGEKLRNIKTIVIV